MWALKAVGVPGEFLILQDVAQRLELSKHLNEFLVISKYIWADEFLLLLVWVVCIFDTLISLCGKPPGYFTELDTKLRVTGPMSSEDSMVE